MNIVRGFLQVVGFFGVHLGLLLVWIYALGYLVGQVHGNFNLYMLVLSVLGLGILGIGGLMSWLIARRMGSGRIYRPAGWLALFDVFILTVFTFYSGFTSLMVQPFMGPGGG